MVVWPRSVIVDFIGFITSGNALYLNMYVISVSFQSFSYCPDFFGLHGGFERLERDSGLGGPLAALMASLRASN